VADPALLLALDDPAFLSALRDKLGLPTEPVAAALHELAEAQRRTEQRLEQLAGRVEQLAGRVEQLAEAQQRTELRIEELAQAQQRTELRLEELAQAQQRTDIAIGELREAVRDLAQAQQRTEVAIGELRGAVHDLAQAQQRTEGELTLLRQTFISQLGGLGARWGLQTEEAFRQGMRTILHEVGFTTERFLEYDLEGTVFGYPDQVELDVVISDGKLMIVEIKSSLDGGNTYLFARKAAFYTQKTGRTVDRKLIVAPYADNRAKEVGLRLGVEICTDITTLR